MLDFLQYRYLVPNVFHLLQSYDVHHGEYLEGQRPSLVSAQHYPPEGTSTCKLISDFSFFYLSAIYFV